MNTSRPSEHPPVRGGKCRKRLGGIMGCEDKTSSWHLIGFSNGSNFGSTASCRGETHAVILYTYINRHAGTPNETKTKRRAYVRWTSSLPSCLKTLRIFPSLPGSRPTILYLDTGSAFLQIVNQWLNFTCSRSHVYFRYERKNTNPTLVRIELTTSALAGVQVTY